jgi:hypothetical protein
VLGGAALLVSQRAHRAGHAFAIADAALAAHFNLQDRLAEILAVNDRDITEFKAPRLVGPQAGIDREQHIVVKLLRFPLEALLLRLVRALLCAILLLVSTAAAKTNDNGRPPCATVYSIVQEDTLGDVQQGFSQEKTLKWVNGDLKEEVP